MRLRIIRIKVSVTFLDANDNHYRLCCFVFLSLSVFLFIYLFNAKRFTYLFVYCYNPSMGKQAATQSQMRIIIIYILKVTTMNISKKKAKQIADLINSLEVTYMIGEDEYGKDRFIEKINETTQELFDLGIPMVILRDEEKA